MWVWLGGQGKSNVHMQDLSTSKVLLNKMMHIYKQIAWKIANSKKY